MGLTAAKLGCGSDCRRRPIHAGNRDLPTAAGIGASCRESSQPDLDILRPISHERADLDELRPTLFKSPASKGTKADVQLLGHLIFSQKIKHIHLIEFRTSTGPA